MLLSQPVNPSVYRLPSPNPLKRKILIKVRCCTVLVYAVHLPTMYCCSIRNLRSMVMPFQCQSSRIQKVRTKHNFIVSFTCVLQILLILRWWICLIPSGMVSCTCRTLSTRLATPTVTCHTPLLLVLLMVGVAGAFLCAHSNAVDLHRWTRERGQWGDRKGWRWYSTQYWVTFETKVRPRVTIWVSNTCIHLDGSMVNSKPVVKMLNNF